MNQNEAQLQVWAMQWMDLDGAEGNQDCLRQRLLMLYQVSAIYRW